MTDSFELRSFDAGHPPNARDISGLHTLLLPRSPIAILGRRFCERFYYVELPRVGLLFGTVAYVGGKPAGFAVAALDSNGFIRSAVRRSPFRTAWFAGIALLTGPRRIAPLWEGAKIQMDREHSGATGKPGELLSIGVLPKYRGETVQNGAKLNIARDMMLDVLRVFRGAGVAEVLTFVDADNKASRRFFEKLGAIEGRADVPGWRNASVELILEPRKIV